MLLRFGQVPASRRLRQLFHPDLEQPGLSVLEAVIRRDRALTAAALVALAGMAWVWVVRMAAPMGSGAASVAMPGMPGVESGTAPGLPWLAGMWAVMMVAMMLPSAAPTILMFCDAPRRAP